MYNMSGHYNGRTTVKRGLRMFLSVKPMAELSTLKLPRFGKSVNNFRDNQWLVVIGSFIYNLKFKFKCFYL